MPTDYRITRSATIDAPPEKVFEQVNNFHKWGAWSPWLEYDPNAKVTIEGAPGKDATYKWSGNDKIGEGIITMTESQPYERIKFKLQIIRPLPITADAEFTFKAKEDKTVITWTMTGERDYKHKAIGVVFDPIIGKQFEKGLEKIKAVVEGESKK